MNFQSWMLSTPSGGTASGRRVRPELEVLEDRTLPAASVLQPTAVHARPEKLAVCSAVAQVGNISKQADQILRRLETARKNLQKKLNDRVGSLTSQVRSQIEAKRQRLGQLTARARQSILHSARRFIDPILNKKLIAYDLSTTGTLTLNLATGSYFGALDLGFGATLDTEALRAFTEGTPPIPNIDPLQGAAAALGLKLKETSSYRSVRDSFVRNPALGGPGNVYFASERFVRWASPKTIARYGAAVVATGSAALPAILREVRAYVLLELNDILSWLRVRGMQQTEKIAGNMLGALLESMVTGTAPNFSLPDLKMQVQGTTVPYQFDAEPIGITQLPGPLLRKLESARPRVPGVTGGFNHLAFAISISGGTAGDPLQNAINQFDQSKGSLTGVVENNFSAILDAALGRIANRGVHKLLRKLNPGVFASIAASVGNSLISQIGLSKADLQKAFVEGNPVISLKDTPAAKNLEKFLGPLAQGNESSVSIDELELSLNGFALTVKATLRHRHSWGTAGEVLGSINRYFNERSREFAREARNLERALKNDVKDLQRSANEALREVRVDLQEDLNNLCNRASDFLAAEAARALEEAREFAERARQAASDGFNTAREGVRHGLDQGGAEIQKVFGGGFSCC